MIKNVLLINVQRRFSIPPPEEAVKNGSEKKKKRGRAETLAILTRFDASLLTIK